MSFTFTRNPSTKVSVDVQNSGLVAADNELVIIGHMATTGSTATANAPILIDNYGDPVAVATECDAKFGAGAEVSEMVVAAVKANFYSDQSSKAYPPIKVIPLAHADDGLAALLAANLAVPIPFGVIPYPASNTTQMAAFKAHLQAISASDRGFNAQFGSFGFMATDEDTTAASTEGTTAASEVLMIAWLRDLAGTKANKIHQVAAALAAVCAANGAPFMPLNDISVGGLVAPSAAADFHTSGDAGTVSLGLSAGLIPLYVDNTGAVRVSRSVTTRRSIVGVEDTAYYDMQDWQGLYYYRKNAYVRAQSDVFKRAKASDRVLLALKSELIAIAKDFELQEIFQDVDKFADQFTVTRPLDNRFAGIYSIPVNVVPGFHNKGIALHGTTQFDTFTL